MEEPLGTEVATSREGEDERVNAWRVDQLANLGLPMVIASAFATVVDWHDVARLVDKGCPPDLALEITR